MKRNTKKPFNRQGTGSYFENYRSTLFMLFIFLLVRWGAIGQETSADLNFQKNHIMFNPLALTFGNIQFEYERPLNKNLSLGLAVGAKVSSGIFKMPGLKTTTITTNDFNFSGIQLTPEIRWYVQKGERNHTGFFVGGYYRYQNYKDEIQGVYTSSISADTYPIDVETKLISNTIGMEIGYKLPIKKHFFIDFIIAGPGLSFNKIKIKEKQPLPLEFYVLDVGEAIVDGFTILEIVNTDINFDEIDATGGKSTFQLPAFHYGIRVGYSF